MVINIPSIPSSALNCFIVKAALPGSKPVHSPTSILDVGRWGLYYRGLGLMP